MSDTGKDGKMGPTFLNTAAHGACGGGGGGGGGGSPGYARLNIPRGLLVIVGYGDSPLLANTLVH